MSCRALFLKNEFYTDKIKNFGWASKIVTIKIFPMMADDGDEAKFF